MVSSLLNEFWLNSFVIVLLVLLAESLVTQLQQVCAVSEYFTVWLLCCFLFLSSITKHIQLYFLS